MKNIIKIWIFSCCFLTSSFLFSQEKQTFDTAFKDGEEVVYKVFYNWKFIWVPAGEVSFRTTFKEDHIEFNVNGKTYPSYDSFFKVRDNYVSRVNKNNLLPINFKRDILEGSYVRFDSIAFDQENHLVYEYFGNTKDDAAKHEFKLNGIVLDMLSAIYHFRSLNLSALKKNDEVPFDIFFDKELFNLNLKFLGSKNKKIKNIGKLDCWQFEVDLIQGNTFNEGDVMHIWVSKDLNKIPLMIESPVTIGSVKAILKSAIHTKESVEYYNVKK